MADDDTKERGPVKYLAFAEIAPGHWVVMGEPGREATSVHALRKEIRAELSAATEQAGRTPESHNLVLVPIDRAHIITAAHEVEVRETFRKATLSAGPDLSTVIRQEETEADVAARMAAGPVPPGAIEEPPAPPVVEAPVVPDAPLDAAAERRAEAERIAAAAAASVPPDVDPNTLLSKRTAAEATALDEGRTVFPMDER
jgi:hypothetical protein